MSLKAIKVDRRHSVEGEAQPLFYGLAEELHTAVEAAVLRAVGKRLGYAPAQEFTKPTSVEGREST